MKIVTTCSLAAALSVLVGVSAAHAKTYKGLWNNNPQWSSTVDFLDGNRVTYCFQSDCYTTKYSGSEKGTVRFNWGQAKFTMKWNGNGYNMTRTVGGNSLTGTLK